VNPRTREQRLFGLLVSASVVFFTAQGMLFPVLPRYVKNELHGGPVAVGVVVSSFAFGAMIARPYGGRMADRIGRRRVATFGSLLWATMVALYPVGGAHAGVAGVVTVRAIGGIGAGVLFVAMAAMATDLWPEERRVQAFSLFSMSTLFGFATGPAIGEWLLADRRWGLTYGVIAVLALAPAIAMRVLPDTRRTVAAPEPEAKAPALFHRAALRPGVALLLGSTGFITFAAFVPLHADELGLERVWPVLLLNPAVTLLTRLAGASFADTIDRRLLTGISLGFVAAAAATLALVNSPEGIYLAAVFNGIGSAYVFPGFLAMTADASTERERASAIGSLTVFSDLASSAGGALLGLAADAWGYRGAFGTAAVLAVCSIAILAALTLGSPRGASSVPNRAP
jgi:MFS family permease